MACVICAEIRRLAKISREKLFAHQARLEALRRGENPDVQAEGATEQAAVAATEAGKATGDQQAGDPSTAHGERRVAKDSGAGTGKRRAPVPVVRKAGSGKASPR